MEELPPHDQVDDIGRLIGNANLQNKNWRNANTPGLPMTWERHRRNGGRVVEGVREATFHDFLDARVAAKGPDPTAQDLRLAIKEAWDLMDNNYSTTDGVDYGRIGRATDEWLILQGVP